VIVGDGHARSSLEARAARLGVADRIHWLGYVADRAAYMDSLASCDLFVFPSPAEGFPKVILDAMAAGLPVIAAPIGQLEPLATSDLIGATTRRDGVGLAATIAHVAGSAPRAHRLATAGHALAVAHTRRAEIARLVARWRAWWPRLVWPG
jgi:glycosyltransferase involved in cell wall biosynthesis